MRLSIWKVAIVFLVLFGCATARPTRPPPVDVTGKWIGNFSAAWGIAGASMALQQKEATVTGEIVVTGAPEVNGPIRGTVDGDVLIRPRNCQWRRRSDRQGERDVGAHTRWESLGITTAVTAGAIGE